MALLLRPLTAHARNLLQIGLILCTLLWGIEAFANCGNLFRQKKFDAASDCFVKKGDALGPGKKVDKGRLIRNGALVYIRGAKQSSPSEAARMRSKAIALLKRYINENLYENSTMKSSTETQIKKLESQIGYTNLTVVTNHPAAQICLVAGSTKKCKRAMMWSLKILPKTYQATVTYPLNPPVKQSKTLVALPRTQKELVFTPPVKKESLLSVVTGSNGATMSVQNLKTKKTIVHQGSFWSKTLTPGAYELKVIYAGQKPIKRNVKMLEGKPVVLVFRKPGPPVLIINTTPINAQVFVDGKYRGNTGIKLKLQVGQRNIQLRRGCSTLWRKTLTLKPNEERTLSVILQRDPAYLKWQKSGKGSGGAVAGWTVLGIGVAAAGAGGVMQGLANGKHSDANSVRQFDFAGYQRLAGEGNTFRTVGYTGLAVGVVGIGVGIATLVATRPVLRTSIPCQIPIKDEK